MRNSRNRKNIRCIERVTSISIPQLRSKSIILQLPLKNHIASFYNNRHNMSRELFTFIACVAPSLVIADVRSDVFLNEVQSLSQLPMEKLIHLKSAFSDQQETPESSEPLETDFSKSSALELPIALPLKRQDLKPLRRYDDYWQDEKSKSSKISKIFQLAITALSFFAFGGYLLTLIITALRRNTAATSTGNVIFLQGLQAVKRPKRDAVFHDPMENDFDSERLYRGMIMLSEGYALYNQNNDTVH